VNEKVEVFHGVWHAGVVTKVDVNVSVLTTQRKKYRGLGGGTRDEEVPMVIHNDQLAEFIRKPVLYLLREKVELYYDKRWVGGSIIAIEKDKMTVKFDEQPDPENKYMAYLNPREIRNCVRKIDTHSKGSSPNKFKAEGPDLEGLHRVQTHINTNETCFNQYFV